MLYDAYKQKVQRLAAVRRFLWKWKALLIVVLSLLVAFVTTYICLKGKITRNVSFSAPTVTYGEEYEPNPAKAMLGKVKGYEYRAEGETKWRKTKPVAAGRYYVRAVTGGAFGVRRGSAVPFTILPRSVTLGIVADQTVEYGENPTELTVALAGDDALVASELSFAFDSVTQERTQACVETDSIRVVNAAGEDVTDCYAFTAEKAAVRFARRKITVQPAPQTGTYSGTAQTYIATPASVTARDLRFGAEIGFATELTDARGNVVESAVQAGEYTVRVLPETVRITVDGKDVTHLYEPQFAQNESTFTVRKRALTVTTGSAEKPYDGAPLTCDAFTSQGEAEGHTVQLRNGVARVGQTAAGSAPNAYAPEDFTVLDDSGAPVTENYTVQVRCGTLTVTKCPLHVITQSDRNILYDGNVHRLPEFSTDGAHFGGRQTLPNGQTAFADLSAATEVKNAGSADNAFAVYVQDGSGRDTTANYSISYSYGTLAVLPRPVTIATATASKPYDGTPLVAPDITAADCENIVPWHEPRVSGARARITDAGSTANDTKYAIYEYGVDVSGNYTIGYAAPGLLSVTPREVIVQPAGSKTYDGTETIGAAHITDIYPLYTGAAQKFVDGQMPAFTWKYVDAGDHADAISGGYGIVLDTIGWNDGCKEANYTVTSYNGTLTVTPRDVTIAPEDLYYTYGDTIVLQPDWTCANGTQFVNGQTPAFVWVCRQSAAPENAGTYNLYLLRSEDNAATSYKANNYRINATRDATLIIAPREVHLQLVSGTKVYNGRGDAKNFVKFAEGDTPPTLTYAGISAGNTEQAKAHKFLEKDDVRTFPVYYGTKNGAYADPTNVGVYYIFLSEIDTDLPYYNESYANYTIIEENAGQATLTVTPRDVTVKADDVSTVYNGKAYAETIVWQCTGGRGFVEDETPVLQWEFVPTEEYGDRKAGEDAGTYSIRYTGAQANGDFLPANYTVLNADTLGTLTVTPRAVTVQPTGGKIYDGTETFGNEHIPAIYPYGAGEAQQFVSGQTPLFTYAYTDAREHKNVSADGYAITCEAASSETCDLRNYAVTMQTGKFYVVARPVRIAPENFTRTYSGQAVRAENIAWRYYESEYLFLEDPALVWAFYEEPINAGTYPFYLQSWQDNPATGFLKANYLVQAYEGTLTIDPLTVYVRAENFDTESGRHVREYDGVAYNAVSDGIGYAYTSAAQFVAGDVPTLIWRFTDTAGNATVLRNAGEYRVRFDRAENDGNYNIQESGYGTYKITPRRVHIMPNAGQSKTYDGTGDFAVQYTTADGTGFLFGETPDFTWQFDRAPIHAGDGYTIIGCSTENNRNANFMAENYAIACEDTVTVAVTPRTITVAPFGGARYYNGFSTAYADLVRGGDVFFTVTQGEAIAGDTLFAGFVGGITQPYADFNGAEKVADHGTYTVRFCTDVLRWNTDYAVACDTAVYEIKRLPLVVKHADVSAQYSGEEQLFVDTFGWDDARLDDGAAWDEYTWEQVKANLQTLGHTIVSDGVTVRNAGEYPNDARVYVTERDGTPQDNYIVRVERGTITIERMIVYVRAQTFAEQSEHVREYDGTDGATVRYVCTQDTGFVAGDIPTLMWRFTDTDGNATVLRNAGAYRVYFDRAENDGNYDIRNDGFGTYKITPYDLGKEGRAVRIVTNGASRVFNGQPLTESGFTATVAEDFPSRHAFAVTGELPYAFYPFEEDNRTPAVVTNALQFTVRDGRGEDARANFANWSAIAYTYGTLQVLPQIGLYALADIVLYSGAVLRQDGDAVHGLVCDGTRADDSVTAIPDFYFDARVEKVVRRVDNKGNAVSGTENVSAIEAGEYRVYYSVTKLYIGKNDYTHIGLQIVKPPQENGWYYFDLTVEHRTVFVRPKNVTLPYTGDPLLSLSGSDSAYWEIFYGDTLADGQTFAIDGSDALDIRVASWAYVGIVSGRVTSADGKTDQSDNYRIYTAGNYAASGRELSEFQAILQADRKQFAYTRNDTPVTLVGERAFAYNGNAHAVEISANGTTPSAADLFDFDTAQLPAGHTVVLESVSGVRVGTQPLLLKLHILNGRGEDVTKAYFVQTYREETVSIEVRKAKLSIDTSAAVRVTLEGTILTAVQTEDDGSFVYKLTEKNMLRVTKQENGTVRYSIFRTVNGVETEGYEDLYYSVTANGVLMRSEEEERL